MHHAILFNTSMAVWKPTAQTIDLAMQSRDIFPFFAHFISQLFLFVIFSFFVSSDNTFVFAGIRSIFRWHGPIFVNPAELWESSEFSKINVFHLRFCPRIYNFFWNFSVFFVVSWNGFGVCLGLDRRPRRTSSQTFVRFVPLRGNTESLVFNPSTCCGWLRIAPKMIQGRQLPILQIVGYCCPCSSHWCVNSLPERRLVREQ